MSRKSAAFVAIKKPAEHFFERELYEACLLFIRKKGSRGDFRGRILYPEIPSRRAVPRKASSYAPEGVWLAAALFWRGARADFRAAAGHPDHFVPIISSYIKSHISSPLKVLPLLYPIKKRLQLLLKNALQIIYGCYII
jgi:hypothetical protein